MPVCVCVCVCVCVVCIALFLLTGLEEHVVHRWNHANLFLLLQIMLSHLSVVMLPVTITQIQTGQRLEQLHDATAGLAGSTRLLTGNCSWCKHTLGTAFSYIQI